MTSMTDVATCLRAAADSLACARFCPSEVEFAREYTHIAMPGLPPDLAALAEEALSDGDWRTLDQIANAFEPPAMPMPQPKPRRQHKPTLASVAKQASKAAIAVARYEVRPDGIVVVVTGTPEPSTESNPWLDDLKVTKQ
jgi:hypothetical protein